MLKTNPFFSKALPHFCPKQNLTFTCLLCIVYGNAMAALHLNILVHVQCHKIGQLSRDFAVKQVSDKFIIFVSALGYTVVWDTQGNVKITVSKCDAIARFAKNHWIDKISLHFQKTINMFTNFKIKISNIVF